MTLGFAGRSMINTTRNENYYEVGNMYVPKSLARVLVVAENNMQTGMIRFVILGGAIQSWLMKAEEFTQDLNEGVYMPVSKWSLAVDLKKMEE